MFRLLSALILLNLWMSFPVYAELRDPTRPPGYINTGEAGITTWQLNAVIIANDHKVAIINGQPVKIGEQIAGNQLTDIQPNSVQLKGVDGKMTLYLLDASLNIRAD